MENMEAPNMKQADETVKQNHDINAGRNNSNKGTDNDIGNNNNVEQHASIKDDGNDTHCHSTTMDDEQSATGKQISNKNNKRVNDNNHDNVAIKKQKGDNDDDGCVYHSTPTNDARDDLERLVEQAKSLSRTHCVALRAYNVARDAHDAVWKVDDVSQGYDAALEADNAAAKAHDLAIKGNEFVVETKHLFMELVDRFNKLDLSWLQDILHGGAAELVTKAAALKAKTAVTLESERKLKQQLTYFPVMYNTYRQVMDDNKRTFHYVVPPITLNNLSPHEIQDVKKDQGISILSSLDAWKDVESIVIPTSLRQEPDAVGMVLESILGGEALDHDGGCKGIRLFNEPNLWYSVKSQAEDMMKCLGLDHTLRFHCAIPIFSGMRNVMIGCWNHTPLFYIQAESPERKEGEVFSNNEIGIQMWNHLMCLKKIGHRVPIACLGTYNKLTIMSDQDLTKHQDHTNFLAIMKKTFTTKTITSVVSPEHKKSRQSEEESSPTKRLIVKLIDIHKEENSTQHDIDVEPKIFQSKVYLDGQVPQALLAALFATYHHNNDDKDFENKLIVVDQGDHLGGQLTPKASKDCMIWTTIRKGVYANFNAIPEPTDEYFYLLGRIGRGLWGKVYLASTSNGDMCAIKIKGIHNPKKQGWTKAEGHERDEELSMWKRLYPNLNAQSRNINGFPALVMVYGRQMDRMERKKRLEEVKSELKRFAKEGLAHGSLYWYNITLHNDRVLLVDLDSLEDISSLNEKEKDQDLMDSMSYLESTIDHEVLGLQPELVF